MCSAGLRGQRGARADRNDLIEGFVAADHAELAARALFDGRHARLEIRDFGDELLVALDRLCVFRLLALDRFRQARELAHAIAGQPEPVLQQQYDGEQRSGEPLHEKTFPIASRLN